MNKSVVSISAAILVLLCQPVMGKEISPATPSDEDNYTFDPQLFRGSRFSQSSLAKLTTRESVAPGNYKMDIYTNNKLSGSWNVTFKEAADGRVLPCLTPEVADAIGLKTGKIRVKKIRSVPLLRNSLPASPARHSCHNCALTCRCLRVK